MSRKNNIRWLSAILASTVMLSGCSYIPSWAGGKSAEKPKEAGERIAVLPAEDNIKSDPALLGKGLVLPAVTKNDEWPAHSGMFTADTSNLAGGGFDHSNSATAGEGIAFENTLLISPVVGGGLVFAMDSTGHISAHKAADVSSVVWQGKGVSVEDDPFILGGGLAYNEGKLYATSGLGLIVVMDAATGKEIWRKSLHVPFRSAPRVAGSKLFATTIDNQLYAINTANGEVAWTQRGISETTGLINTVSPAVAGDMVVVPYSSGEVYVLYAPDGKEVWSESLSGGKRLQASALFAGIGGDPVVDGAVVFTVSSGGSLSVKSLAAGQAVWDVPVGSVNTPWVTGDYIYMLSSENTVLALHKFDGHIRWSTKLASYEDEAKKKDPISWKGPVLVDGKLALVSSNGQLVLVNAIDGKVAATKSIPEGIYTAPVVAGGRMYLMGQNATLYSLQ